MEELLLQVVKEATGTKLMNLKNASQIAHGKLKIGYYELFSRIFNSLPNISLFQINCFVSMVFIEIHRMSCVRYALQLYKWLWIQNGPNS